MEVIRKPHAAARVLVLVVLAALLVFAAALPTAAVLAVPQQAYAANDDDDLGFDTDDPYHTQSQTDRAEKQQEKEEKAAKEAAKAAGETTAADAAKDKADGTYYGSAVGYQSMITVAVTVQDGIITGIKVVSHADDQSYVDLAMKVIDNIIDEQSTDVDTISGVTYSSTGILDATKDALTGSGAQAVTSTPWFSIAMIILALVLLAGSVWCARSWLRSPRMPERVRAMRMQRVCTQLLFFLMAPSAFASGFMGLKTLFMQIQVMQTQRGYDFEISTFTIFTIVFLLATIVLGRFFCGYACAFGFAGDVIYSAGEWVRKKLRIKRPRLPRRVEFCLRFVKYIVLVAICVVILMGFYMELNNNSPWTAFSMMTSLMFQRVTLVGAVLLALIAVGSLFKERFFCEFLCPMGALFSIMPVLPSGRVRRDRSKCRHNCAACRASCPVAIEPSKVPVALECIQCNRCADVCPAENIRVGMEMRTKESASLCDALNEGSFDDAPRGIAASAAQDDGASSTPKRSIAQILTSRPAQVVWKTVVLLFIFWLMHITRYLPIIS